jgi:hypothetical protein
VGEPEGVKLEFRAKPGEDVGKLTNVDIGVPTISIGTEEGKFVGWNPCFGGEPVQAATIAVIPIRVKTNHET